MNIYFIDDGSDGSQITMSKAVVISVGALVVPTDRP